MNEIQEIRKNIAQLDQRIVYLLAKRLQAVSRIGQLKKVNNQPIEQKKQEEEIVANLTKQAQVTGVSTSFIQNLYKIIFSESKKVQQNPNDPPRTFDKNAKN